MPAPNTPPAPRTRYHNSGQKRKAGQRIALDMSFLREHDKRAAGPSRLDRFTILTFIMLVLAIILFLAYPFTRTTPLDLLQGIPQNISSAPPAAVATFSAATATSFSATFAHYPPAGLAAAMTPPSFLACMHLAATALAVGCVTYAAGLLLPSWPARPLPAPWPLALVPWRIFLP